MQFARTFILLIMTISLYIQATVHAAGNEGVVNRSMGMNLADVAQLEHGKNIATDEGSLKLESHATEGLAASSAIEAPMPSTHLGLVWSEDRGEGSLGLAVRTSLDGGDWSTWRQVAVDDHLSDPASKLRYGQLLTIDGGYRYVQYSVGFARLQAEQSSPRLQSLDFAFINATASGGSQTESMVTDEPSMLSRTEWGCPDGETSSNNPNPTYTDVSHLIVHHTATSNTATDWAAEVRAMWSYHVQTRGWADIGYNFLVDPNGAIYIGRAGGDNVQGAHFSCQNGGTQGVAVIGDFTNVTPTVAALDSLEDLLAWLASREGLDTAAVSWHSGTQLDLYTISGHRDGNPSTTGCTVTACPGDTFYPMLPEVRVNVEALIAAAQIPDPVIKDQQSEIIAAFSGSPDDGQACHGVFEVNNKVLANIHTAEHGCRLHRIEASGEHIMLADIDTTPQEDALFEFGTSPPLDGWHYFSGTDGDFDLWRTDGLSVEPVFPTGQWPQRGAVTGRGQMNGRLYFTVTTFDSPGAQTLYSTNGNETRAETSLDPIGNSDAKLVGTFFNRLLFVGTEPTYGSEPRTFDGESFTLLRDIVPGATGSTPQLFSMLDDLWFFVAQKPDQTRAFFSTDGDTVTEIPSAESWVEQLDADDPAIKSSGAVYMARNIAPVVIDPPGAPTLIMRLETDKLATYSLDNNNADIARPTMAVLGDEALVLVENRIFRLGEMAAEELPYNFPTDQDGAGFEFIGSSPYYPYAYVQETNSGEDSHVWAWSEQQLGVLLAGEGKPVVRADHFRHIGEDIWFYGEDAVSGRALRRIPGGAARPAPWMAAVTGSWYDPATSGQGFVLHPIDESRAVVSFYSFENNGAPLWLIGTAETPFEAGIDNEITLYESSGGNFGSFDPEQVSTDPWGALRINFQTCREATAELVGESGRQTLLMQRLAGLAGLECKTQTPPTPSGAGMSGTWFDPATTGQGFVLHRIDENRLIVSFYGFGADAERLWLIGLFEGSIDFGQSLVLDLTLATGGNFGSFIPEDINRESWGTLTIEFENCTSATAMLDGIDGQQTMQLQKLAGLEGSERNCPQ